MSRHHRTKEDDKRYKKNQSTKITKQRLARREEELIEARKKFEIVKKNNPGYSYPEKMDKWNAESDIEVLEAAIQRDRDTLKFNKSESWSTLAGILVFGIIGLIVLVFIVIFLNDVFG